MTTIHFAPLQGYTEAPYRNFHASTFGGADVYYTPFVRIEKGDFRRRELRDIEPDNNTVPRIIPQLIASTPDETRRIADMLAGKGYREIDINLGCPFPLLVGKHKGSGLLPYPEEAENLLKTIGEYSEIHFSVKMRLGWEDKEECIRLLPLLNELPLAHITLHPRIGKQQYKGVVDVDGFAAFYEGCRHQLIYNGDLKTREDITQIMSRFPRLAGIMAGRGLLANPALALEYKMGKELPFDEKKKRLGELHAGVYDYYRAHMEGGEAQILTKMRTFWEYLWPDADKKLRKKILKSSRTSAYEAAVWELFNHSVR